MPCVPTKIDFHFILLPFENNENYFKYRFNHPNFYYLNLSYTRQGVAFFLGRTYFSILLC